MANERFDNAKKNKNDEFYTRLEDIEKELEHYKEFFKGKTIFCNCDDPRVSNFFKYFALNFNNFGIKKIISFFLQAPQCGRPHNNELNRKNGSANGRIGAKVAVA